MSRNLIVTMVSNSFQHVGELTVPYHQAYANRIGADFMCITGNRISTHLGWEKLRIAEFLREYDRVAWVDSDCLVMQNCPNLFEVVPEDTFAAVDEWPLWDYERKNFIEYQKAMCDFYGIPQFEPTRYFNVGVMVVSKIHAPIFEIPAVQLNKWYNEQTYLNIQTVTQNVKFLDLGYKFNHFAVDRTPMPTPKFDSNILHYTAYSTDRVTAIKADLALLKKKEGSL